MNVYQLASKKLDNLTVTPVELLRICLEDIEAGMSNPKGMLVITVDNSSAGDTYTIYRSNITWEREVAVLSQCKHDSLTRK